MKIKLPFIVYEITPRCNLNCKYCYNIWKIPGHTQPEEYGYSQTVKTLKRLFKIADVDTITFSGGEPFVNKRMKELALFCRMKKKGVVIISNGFAGTRDDYSTLKKMGISLFEFPVHSAFENIHDAIAGKEGAWQKAIQSVKNVHELGGDAVVVIVITKLNYSHIDQTLAFIQSLGINRVMLNRFNIGGEGIREKDTIALSNSELKQAFKIAQKTVEKLKMTATSNVCTPFCVLKPEQYPSIGFSSCYPKENNRPWTLDPSGNVRFCNHSPIIAGNIYKQTFEDIIASPYITTWRTVVPEICAACTIFGKCWAGCRAAAEQLGKPLTCADPIVYDEISSS